VPWLKTTRDDSHAGPNGVFSALPPQTSVAVPIPATLQKPLSLPSGVSIIKEATCSHTYRGAQYLVGGFSQNLMMSRELGVGVQGIRPFANRLVTGAGTGADIGVTAVAGALTGSVRVAIVAYDSVMDEISPLSMISDEFTLVAQDLTIDNIPVSIPQDDNFISGTTTMNASNALVGGGILLKELRVGDLVALTSAPTTFARVLAVTDDTNAVLATPLGDGTTQGIIVRRSNRTDMFRIYYQLDGGLFRVAEQRQFGATTVTPAVADLDDLGEAFTEEFDQFPRCKYGNIWQDRQVMSGDVNDPTAVWLSLIGLPERRSSISLNSLNGKEVNAIYVVNDTLIVCAGLKSYRVSGYTEDDIVIQEIQHEVGCISNAGAVNVDGFVFVPTHLGVYLTDGSSWWPLNKKYKRFWMDDYAARPNIYESAFAYSDPIRKVYAIYLEQVPFCNGRNAYMVLDYSTVIPVEGGTFAQPRLSWDTQQRDDECAGILGVPGAKRVDAFTGSCDGILYKRNQKNAETDSNDGYQKRILIVDGADDFSDPGGDDNNGKNFTNFELYAALEECLATVDLYAGDEYAYATIEAGFCEGASDGSPSIRSKWREEFGNSAQTIESTETSELGRYEVKTVWSFAGLPNVSGRRMTLAISADAPADSMRYFGRCFLWTEGGVQRSVAWSTNEE